MSVPLQTPPDPRHGTLDLRDLQRPEVAAVARKLRAFARRLWWSGVPFAVNGVARRRFYLRRYKLWEYARGLAWSDPGPAVKILDFGGGATLPAYWLAAQGKEIRILDVDPRLVELSRAAARAHGWNLQASAADLTRSEPPAGWGDFDRVYSFCVLEHLDPALAVAAFRRLAAALRPGGRLVLSFEYGADSPGPSALRDAGAVREFVERIGLRWSGPAGFHDNGARFRMDKRHPGRRFTFGMLFLEKP